MMIVDNLVDVVVCVMCVGVLDFLVKLIVFDWLIVVLEVVFGNDCGGGEF